MGRNRVFEILLVEKDNKFLLNLLEKYLETEELDIEIHNVFVRITTTIIKSFKKKKELDHSFIKQGLVFLAQYINFLIEYRNKKRFSNLNIELDHNNKDTTKNTNNSDIIGNNKEDTDAAKNLINNDIIKDSKENTKDNLDIIYQLGLCAIYKIEKETYSTAKENLTQILFNFYEIFVFIKNYKINSYDSLLRIIR